ncbi:TPA: hypothetical protein ENS27_05600 [bacterium]|mgnify:CR=1 FL=1|nr:hypothetical protein [bacterium]
MKNTTFFVQRNPFFNINQLENIEEASLRILEKIGIAVLDDDIIAKLKTKFSFKGNRAIIGRKIASDFINDERKRNGNKFSDKPQSIDTTNTKIDVHLIEYSQWVHDIKTDKIVPFDTERLIEATKLLHTLGISGPAGCPIDVPAPIQSVVQYWVSATYSKYGRRRVDPKALETLPYIMDMADVLGDPLKSLPIYIFSPLTLGCESLKCVMEYKDRLSYVHVGNMPSVGCTSPINVGDAFALSSAEVIGSAILLRELIDIPIGWGFSIFPMDLRTLAMVFGSPENFLFQLATSEVQAYFHGTEWYPSGGNIHTNAKLPGAQACAEKSSLMTAGALLGARNFGSVGLLSLDEIFSAEQLIYDLEIRDHVQRLIQGIDGDCDPQRCLNDVIQGIEQKSFISLDTTLENYKNVYWHPKLFDRQFFSAWEGEGAKSNRQKAHAKIQELLNQYEYELDPKLQSDIDKILAKAKSDYLA